MESTFVVSGATIGTVFIALLTESVVWAKDIVLQNVRKTEAAKKLKQYNFIILRKSLIIKQPAVLKKGQN